MTYGGCLRLPSFFHNLIPFHATVINQFHTLAEYMLTKLLEHIQSHEYIRAQIYPHAYRHAHSHSYVKTSQGKLA